MFEQWNLPSILLSKNTAIKCYRPFDVVLKYDRYAVETVLDEAIAKLIIIIIIIEYLNIFIFIYLFINSFNTK